MNNNLNTAKAPYIKHDSPEVKEVVDFADRLRYVLELNINKLRTICGVLPSSVAAAAPGVPHPPVLPEL